MGAVNVGHIIAFAELRDGMSGPAKKVKRDLLAAGAAAGAAVLALRGVSDVIGSNVRSFAEFEGALNNVTAVSGATGAEFVKLKDLALDMGAQTKFSATEAAKAQGFLAMAGLEVNQVMAALPNTLSLAAAGNLELATAADIVTNVMSGFGEPVEELGRLTDILALSAASANTNVEQMGSAMSYVAPVAASTGQSVEATAAAIGILSNAGIQGERAGTTLRGILASLAAPSDAAATIFERLGGNIGQSSIEINDAAGNMLPLRDIVAQLEEAGLTAGDAMTIFGKRAGPGMLALVRQGSGALADFTGELEAAEGAAADMAETQMRGLVGSMTRMESTVDTLSVRIGDVMAPAVATVVDAFVDFSGWLQDSERGVDVLAALLAGAFVTALTAAGVAVWALVPAITAATGGLNLLIPLIAGIGAATVAVALTGDREFGRYAESSEDAKKAIEDLTASLGRLKGKTDEAAGEQIYANLQSAAELVASKMDQLTAAKKALEGMGFEALPSEIEKQRAVVEALTEQLGDAEAAQSKLVEAYTEYVNNREGLEKAQEEAQAIAEVESNADKAKKAVTDWMEAWRREAYETQRAADLLRIETESWDRALEAVKSTADDVFPAIQDYSGTNEYMTGLVNAALEEQKRKIKSVKKETDDSKTSAEGATQRFGELAGVFSSVTSFDAGSLMGTINQLAKGDWVGAAMSAATSFFSWLGGKDDERKRRQETELEARKQRWRDEQEAAEAALQAIQDEWVEVANKVIDAGFETDEWIAKLETLPDHIDADAIRAKFQDGLSALDRLQGFQEDLSSLQSFVGGYGTKSALQQFMETGQISKAAYAEYQQAGGNEMDLAKFAAALDRSNTFQGFLTAFREAEEGSTEQQNAMAQLSWFMERQGVTQGNIESRIQDTNTLLTDKLGAAADVLEGDIKTTLADIEGAIESQTEQLVAAIEGLDLSVTVVTPGGDEVGHGGSGDGPEGYDGFARGGVMRGPGIVGEYGPELADPDTPTRIYSNSQLRAALSGGLGGGGRQRVELVWKDGRVLAEIVGEYLPGSMHERGVGR